MSQKMITDDDDSDDDSYQSDNNDSDDDSDNSDEDGDNKEYIEDGFVVQSDVSDDSDMANEEEKGRDQPKQQHQKRLAELIDEFDDDDINIIQQNKKRKLQKIKDEQDDYVDREDSDGRKSLSRDKSRSRSRGSNQSDKSNKSHESQHTEEDSYDNDEDYQKNIPVEEWTDYENAQEIENIENSDIPERLQIIEKLYGGDISNKDHVRDYCTMESNWIFEFMKLDFVTEIRNHNSSENVIQNKISQVLNFIYLEQYEIMFIYTYKKNEFMTELNLEKLWKIFQLDKEYRVFITKKTKLIEEIKNCKILENQSRELEDLMKNAKDLNMLNNVQQYLDLLKVIAVYSEKNNEEEIFKFQIEHKHLVSQYRDEISVIQSGIARDIPNFCISPEQYVQNMTRYDYQGRDNPYQRHFPRDPLEKPQEYSRNYKLGGVTETRDKTQKITFLSYMSKFIALTLFKHPHVRNLTFKKCFEQSVVNTSPTPRGVTQLDIYHQFYTVKRIKNRIVTEFEDETWIKLIEAQRMNLITVNISIRSEDPKYDRDSAEMGADLTHGDQAIMEILNVNYMSKSSDELGSKWNLFRNEIVRVFYVQFMKPYLIKRIRRELYEIAEQKVIHDSANVFNKYLNIKPQIHKPSEDEVTSKSIMSVVLDQRNRQIGVVFVDKHGEVFENEKNERAELVMKYFFFYKEDDQNNEIVKAEKEEKKKLIEMIQTYQPVNSYLAANCIMANSLLIKLRELKLPHEERGIWLEMMDDTIPLMIANSSQPIQNMRKEIPPVIKVGISMARMSQNAMAEVLNLWSSQNEDNGCLQIPMNIYQKLVNQDRLKNELEKKAVEMVNRVGVDLNKSIQHDHLNCLIQFVCGFGPIKAKKFINDLKKEPDFESNRKIYLINRRRMYEDGQMLQVIYMNCHGFFKLEFSQYELDEIYKHQNQLQARDGLPKPLDRTRINSTNEKIARKIAIDAKEQEDDDDAEIDIDDIYKEILQNHQLIQELDLDGYVQHLTNELNRENMKYVIDFVKDELINPFEQVRTGNPMMTKEQLFYKLTGQNKYSFHEYSIVSATIVEVVDNGQQSSDKGPMEYIRVKIDSNNLSSIIYRREMPRELSTTPLSQIFQRNDVIQAIVTQIIALDNSSNNDDKNKKILNVYLTMDFDSSSLNWIDYARKLFPEKISKLKHESFVIVKNQDFPPRFPTYEIKDHVPKPKLAHRKINHPKYKIMNAITATEYLKDQDRAVGDCIIRPSSAGKEYLTISWKFYESVIVNLKVKQETNKLGHTFIPKYVMNGETFETLDEIIETYIHSANGYMETVVNHKKFLRGNSEMIEGKLKEEKSKDDNIIHYYFGCFENSPQYVVLMYIPKDVVREYIKVKNFGLSFHDKLFQNLKDLIAWFKANFRSEDYKRWVRKTKPPIVDDQSNMKGQIKDEIIFGGRSIKNEKGSFRDGLTCSHCLKQGHTAQNCRNQENTYQNHYQDDRRRNDSYTSNIKCHSCQGIGHKAFSCPVNKHRSSDNNSTRTTIKRDVSRSNERNFGRSDY